MTSRLKFALYLDGSRWSGKKTQTLVETLSTVQPPLEEEDESRPYWFKSSQFMIQNNLSVLPSYASIKLVETASAG